MFDLQGFLFHLVLGLVWFVCCLGILVQFHVLGFWFDLVVFGFYVWLDVWGYSFGLVFFFF